MVVEKGVTDETKGVMTGGTEGRRGVAHADRQERAVWALGGMALAGGRWWEGSPKGGDDRSGEEDTDRLGRTDRGDLDGQGGY